MSVARAIVFFFNYLLSVSVVDDPTSVPVEPRILNLACAYSSSLCFKLFVAEELLVRPPPLPLLAPLRSVLLSGPSPLFPP
jgi:hypothetical protein